LPLSQSGTIEVATATVTTEIPVLLHSPMFLKHLFGHNTWGAVRQRGVEGH